MVRYRNLSKAGKKRRRKKIANTIKGVAEVAGTALTVARSVAKLINVEFKYWDTTSALNPSTTPGVIHLTGISQGDGPSNRDGDSIKVKSCAIKMYGVKNPSATSTQVLITLVLDLLPSGTPPSASQVYENSPSVIGFRNLDYKNRFVILKEWRVHLGDHTMFDREYFKAMDMQTTFTSTSAAATQGKHLFLLYQSTEATNTPNLYVRTRVRYLDN